MSLWNRSSNGSVWEETVKEVDEDSKREARKPRRKADKVVDSFVKCSALLGVAAFVAQQVPKVMEVDLPLTIQWLNVAMKGLFVVGMAFAAIVLASVGHWGLVAAAMDLEEMLGFRTPDQSGLDWAGVVFAILVGTSTIGSVFILLDR